MNWLDRWLAIPRGPIFIRANQSQFIGDSASYFCTFSDLKSANKAEHK
jgi:hypothetical protein